MKIESDANDEAIERLPRVMNRHCPLPDDLRNPLEVELAIKRSPA